MKKMLGKESVTGESIECFRQIDSFYGTRTKYDESNIYSKLQKQEKLITKFPSDNNNEKNLMKFFSKLC